MSTNKPSFGAVVLEIASWILRKKLQISTFYNTNLQSAWKGKSSAEDLTHLQIFPKIFVIQIFIDLLMQTH